MASEAEELARAVTEARDELVGFVLRCSPEGWATSPLGQADLRPVAVITDNFAVYYENFTGWMGGIVAGGTVALTPLWLVDEMNAAHAAEAGVPAAAGVAERLRHAGDGLAELVRGLSDEQLGIEDGRLRLLAQISARHAGSHRSELERALGWAGGEVPAAPRAGELVTETLDYDGGRGVTVYLPPAPPEAVVFAADGQGFSKWGRFLEAVDVPPTMVVGVHGPAEEMPRLHEYSPVFDADRFAAHEKFFVEDVRRWVRSRFGVALPAARTAVFGYSAGGELALALGLRHPDVYGAVFSGSPGGGYKPPADMPRALPRVYLFGGTQEPFFLDNATRWAVALRDAGADVVTSERDVSHGAKLWRAEFPLMVAWAFR